MQGLRCRLLCVMVVGVSKHWTWTFLFDSEPEILAFDWTPQSSKPQWSVNISSASHILTSGGQSWLRSLALMFFHEDLL